MNQPIIFTKHNIRFYIDIYPEIKTDYIVIYNAKTYRPMKKITFENLERIYQKREYKNFFILNGELYIHIIEKRRTTEIKAQIIIIFEIDNFFRREIKKKIYYFSPYDNINLDIWITKSEILDNNRNIIFMCKYSRFGMMYSIIGKEKIYEYKIIKVCTNKKESDIDYKVYMKYQCIRFKDDIFSNYDIYPLKDDEKNDGYEFEIILENKEIKSVLYMYLYFNEYTIYYRLKK